jgi:hypothetical protein
MAERSMPSTGICGKAKQNEKKRNEMNQNEARHSENMQDETNAAKRIKRSEAKQKEEGRSKPKQRKQHDETIHKLYSSGKCKQSQISGKTKEQRRNMKQSTTILKQPNRQEATMETKLSRTGTKHAAQTATPTATPTRTLT